MPACRKYFFPSFIGFIISIYLTGLVIFFIGRIILFIPGFSPKFTADVSGIQVLMAFLYGLRFDTTVSCYILSLPFFMLVVNHFSGNTVNHLIRIAFIIIMFFYSLAFLIAWSDIPYFHFFHTRLNSVIFNWFTSPEFMISLIFSEWRYWIFIFPFLLSVILFFIAVKWLKLYFLSGNDNRTIRQLLYGIPATVLVSGLMILGIRGRIEIKSPIRTGTAYFCDDPFLNQLGLNPVFTLIFSSLEDVKEKNRKLSLMEEKQALEDASKFLNVPVESAVQNPFTRNVTTAGEPRKLNIVILIMEGMSEYWRGEYGGPGNLTPVLDSLEKKSLSFKNIFSSGIHTYNGIYSVLFSYPALLKQHPMLRIPAKQYAGGIATLKKNGYQTIFFTSHDDQFDNAGGFLRANGFDRIISENDYPSEKILSTLGVPDDFLYEFSIPVLTGLYNNQKPFFAAYMTGSNHDPVIIPDWVKFKPNSKNKYEAIIEYCDWAVENFLQLASNEPWFDSTLFVITGDHGSSVSWIYEMPLTYHHVPFIVYAPGIKIHPEINNSPGGQIDIIPTLMGIMNFSYINNTSGVDLRKEIRPFIYFSADDKIGCIGRELFFIHSITGNEYLYRYKSQDTRNYIVDFALTTDTMRNYAFSMLQSAQWVLKNEKQDQ